MSDAAAKARQRWIYQTSLGLFQKDDLFENPNGHFVCGFPLCRQVFETLDVAQIADHLVSDVWVLRYNRRQKRRNKQNHYV